MTLDDLRRQDHFTENDKKFMKLALQLARRAFRKGEVPVGSLLVDKNGLIISHSSNLREHLQTPLGHSELITLHRASQKKTSWRLPQTTLYVTLEPCFMCAGAISQSRIERVVFAAWDPKGGALGSIYNIASENKLNHRFKAEGGLFQEESSALLKIFFKAKRKK